jgi:hypothetical protein
VQIGLLFLASLYAVIGGVPHGHADEMPVEVLFQRAEYGRMLLSPDGMYLAGVVRFKGRNNLNVADLQKRQATLVTSFDNSDVLQFFWINNSRLVLAAGDAEDASGVARSDGWYAVDRDGSRWRRLGGFTFLGLSPDGGDDIIVATRKRGVTINDAYRLNTWTQRSDLLSFDSPGDVLSWVVDREGMGPIAAVEP